MLAPEITVTSERAKCHCARDEGEWRCTVELRSFLTSVLGGGEETVSSLGRFTSGKEFDSH